MNIQFLKVNLFYKLQAKVNAHKANIYNNKKLISSGVGS